VSDPGLTVLAVDDERPQLEDLARMLRASRHVREVLTADSAHDAVLLASRRRFDAIFLDVRMPELDGLELGRVFKAFARAPALVFVSAFDTAAVEAFELRALDYLMKPVAPHRVEEALTRVAAEWADAECRFEAHGFVRVHRQYVANLRRAIEVRPLLNGTAVLRFEDGSEIPVARRQVSELRRWLHT
jgi:DNA-binding LytR/AlgR family response regulator